MNPLMRLGTSILLVVLPFFYMSCSSNSNARLEVRLTDSPGDYEEVNIDIQDVQVNASEGNSGWISLDIKKGIYDIRKLTNGIDTLMGAVELPTGKIQQIRLVLGSDNSVKINGQNYDLGTPSAQTSGLKLNLHADLAEGITYKILVDFDAGKSIVKRGNGTYSLKPVIRAVEEATNGGIKGSVTPIEASPAIFAIADSDTVATAFADEAGKFLVRGLPAGSYTVSIVPKEGFATINKTAVSVTLGSVTDLGVIEF